MKVPKSVLVIGTADWIMYLGKGKTRTNERTLSSYILAVNQAHTILYLFPNRVTGARKTIQGGHIHSAVEYNIPSVDLKAVGTVARIQYSTDLWNDDMSKYEHVFDSPPTLYADKMSRFCVMAIKTKRGKIMSGDGIIG
jgi:hypothetical protein